MTEEQTAYTIDVYNASKRVKIYYVPLRLQGTSKVAIEEYAETVLAIHNSAPSNERGTHTVITYADLTPET
jgi:hypothetical protein